MSVKISTSETNIKKTHTRVILSESRKDEHRFVELVDGTTEYRMGVGKFKNITPRQFHILARTIVRTLKAHRVTHASVTLSYNSFPALSDLGEAWFYRTFIENILLADYEYTQYKSKKEKYSLIELVLLGGTSKAAKAGIKTGTVVASYIASCRDLSNTPGGDMTPTVLAQAAKKLAKDTKVKVTILARKEIEALNMGALLAVGKGAMNEPKLIVMEYMGGKKGEKPIVFIGKGITFDTGGLQVKPGMSMYEMHMDMSGGASVIAAILAVAKLGLKRNIVTIVPSAENAISERSMRPGDVITSMSGKTIDVLHTDAEGRLVLADALTYAKRHNPSLVIDVATLTGASLVALGRHAHAIMTKDRKLEDTLRDLGEKSGDYVSPLPLWDEYIQYTKGANADIANVPQGDPRDGGAINGGAFLSHFAEKMHWAHIDMAPRMTAAPSDKLAKGATGEPTRLLVHIAENL